MICPLTLTMQQASGTIKDLEDHIRKLNTVMKCCEANCALWNKKYQCCDEVARTIIIEKYLKEIVDKLGWLKNLAPH